VSMHATRETICEGQLWHFINTVVPVFIGFVMELRFQTQPRKSSAKGIRENAPIPHLIYALQAEARAT
jgi:hypothetical protein